jgi:hypothetical protein
MSTPAERQPRPPVGEREPHPPVGGPPTGRVAAGGNGRERLSTAPGRIRGKRLPAAVGGNGRERLSTVPGPRRPSRSRGWVALLAGVGIVLLYLAGAAVSGRASILARRPLLDGLAPPTPYRWVNPPPDLAASNKPPASARFTLELTADGSRLGAFSTRDGQINLVLSEGAVPAQPGQTSVEVAVDPIDPATLGPVPSGLVGAGNAYRIQASYRPSGGRVETLGGQSSVGLVYPLLATAVADPGGHLVLSSADGQDWERLQSTDTPGTHQVSAGLTRTGYVQVGVAPASGGSGGDPRNRILLLGTGIAAAIVIAALVLRLRESSRARSRSGRRRR